MTIATNGDVRIAYEIRGEGEPVLFVHGLGYDRRGWGPLPDLLAEEFRVVLVDNRAEVAQAALGVALCVLLAIAEKSPGRSFRAGSGVSAASRQPA